MIVLLRACLIVTVAGGGGEVSSPSKDHGADMDVVSSFSKEVKKAVKK